MATTPKRLANGRWYTQIYLGRHPETGKHRFISKTFAREKEAKAWATSLESQKNDGLYRPTTTKVTFATYLTAAWLPSYRTQVRSTYTIEKTLGKWVLAPRPDTPFLGRIPLHKLTVADFDRLYVAMAAQGMQARGIAHLHGLLKRALKMAVRKGELARNPADFATLPKPDVDAEIRDASDEEAGPVQYLHREQATRFLMAARQDRWSALWHLLLDGGLRPGEAFALQRSHVDWERSLVKVRATLTRQGVPKRKQGGQGWKRTKPKTETSNRDVPVSAATMQELKRWKKQQAAERLQMGAEWQDHDFLFTTETGSPLGNNMGRAWDRVLAAADGRKGDLGTWGSEPAKPRSGPTPQRSFTPKFPLYVLRHTSATLALLDGVDLLTVSRRLGHKNISITARFYGHVQAEHSVAAAESFNRLAASVQ
jgi:integrase